MDILPQLLVNALITGSIYALASSGLSLTYGLLRILNFAHGHFMMAGAYVFYFFVVEHELALFPAALLTIIAGAIFSFLALKIFIFPFTAFSFFLAFVTTIALGTLLESAVSIVFGVNVKSLSTGASFESIEIGGVYITPVQIIIIASAIILLSLLACVIHKTPFGRRVRALSESEHAAQALGMSKNKISTLCFTVATLFAIYAGVMVGYETNLQPTMGNAYTIKAFAAMILGGLGNIWGTIAGSYLLGLIENLSIGLDFGGYSLPAGYKDAFAFLIILLVLLFRPQGLFVRGGRKF